MTISVHIATASHVGAVRSANQDRAIQLETVAAVADGMGGHAGGEIAAETAVEVFAGIQGPVDADGLFELVKAANQAVHTKAVDPELNGMGTTLVAASYDAETGTMLLANVGDSRAYLYSAGSFRQITHDHSLVNELMKEGRITEDEARVHPQRNILTRVLGINAEVAIDQFDLKVYGGDKILLCSDGLTNEVDDPAISAILARFDNPEDAAEVLVEKALEGGGRDNITVALLFVDNGAGVPIPRNADAEGVDGEPTEAVEPVFYSEVDTSEGPPIAEPADMVPDQAAPKQSMRSRLRSVFTAMLVVGVLGVAAVAINSYAKDAWYADEVDGQVVILQGRPGGFLWVQPSEVENSEILVETLDGISFERLQRQPEWNSLDDARQFVQNLKTVDEVVDN